ncbi:MAG: MFS transporter [Thermoanaerobacteraceae bacterium]|nr:MFS transporter [Thermoanaerobacteraceae bacterium]
MAQAVGTKHQVKNKWVIHATISIGVFMATLDGSIVNVALPTIARNFRTPLETLQWVVTAYLLTISSLLPVFGRLADILGKKLVYSTGFLIFVLGSALCGLSSQVYMLIVMRVIQAAGASMLMANAPGIITGIFPPQERGRALGLIGTVVAIGSMTGPALGGILVTQFGWSSIFFINVPVGLLGYIAARRTLPPDRKNEYREPFDWFGAISFTGGMLLLLLGISNGKDVGWTSPGITGSILTGIILLVAFVIIERRVTYPLIDLSLFNNKTFSAGASAGLISFISMFSVMILIPFYLQDILGLPPYQVGLTMTTFPLAMGVIAPISGWLSDKIGHVLLTTSGLAVNTLGLLFLTTLTADTGVAGVAGRLVVLGVGIGIFQSPNNSSVMGAVPRPKLGVAGGINSLVRNVGMVIGIAFSVSLFTARRAALSDLGTVGSFLQSLDSVFYWSAAISTVGILVSAMRSKPKA